MIKVLSLIWYNKIQIYRAGTAKIFFFVPANGQLRSLDLHSPLVHHSSLHPVGRITPCATQRWHSVQANRPIRAIAAFEEPFDGIDYPDGMIPLLAKVRRRKRRILANPAHHGLAIDLESREHLLFHFLFHLQLVEILFLRFYVGLFYEVGMRRRRIHELRELLRKASLLLLAIFALLLFQLFPLIRLRYFIFVGMDVIGILGF